jgi:hypothetical protein
MRVMTKTGASLLALSYPLTVSLSRSRRNPGVQPEFGGSGSAEAWIKDSSTRSAVKTAARSNVLNDQLAYYHASETLIRGVVNSVFKLLAQ